MTPQAVRFARTCGLTEGFLIDTEEHYGVPPHILLGLIRVESGGERYAMRYEKNYPYFKTPRYFALQYQSSTETERQLQKFSYGLTQLMGSTARDIGFSFHLSRLLEPTVGASWGAAYLMKLYKRYQDWDKALSAYNQGTPKKNWMTGKFKNQRYVDKVRYWARHYGEKAT